MTGDDGAHVAGDGEALKTVEVEENKHASSDLSEPAVLQRLAAERALVDRAKRGEVDAVAAIYRLYRPRVERTVAGFIRDRSLCEDLAADTFVRAFERLEAYTWKGRGFGPWLTRIARNLCLDYIRRNTKGTTMPEGFEQSIPDDGAESAETLIFAQEGAAVAKSRVAECLGVIKPRYAQALELRFLLNVPRPIAAEMMKVKIGTFDVLVCRASAAFRKVYFERYPGDRPRSKS